MKGRKQSSGQACPDLAPLKSNMILACFSFFLYGNINFTVFFCCKFSTSNVLSEVFLF
uniref:Uncharacterized protein n=1 Tax=Rhizophora mucronata TaxID=61149 RepID=A0A2P2JHQ8_RHIMU